MLLAGAVLIPLMTAGVVPGPCAALGAMTGMWATLIVNDVALPVRRITSVLVPFSAAAAVTFAALFDIRSQVVGAAIFVAVTFAGVWVRRYGPRGFALGQMAIFVMLFSLFLRIAPEQLGPAYLALAVGEASAFLIRYAAIPDDPHVVLRAAVAAFAARMRLLRAAVAGVARGDEPGAQQRLCDELVALNAAAIAIDRIVAARIFAIDDAQRREARVALLEAELAADRLAEATLAHRADTRETELASSLPRAMRSTPASRARARRCIVSRARERRRTPTRRSRRCRPRRGSTKPSRRPASRCSRRSPPRSRSCSAPRSRRISTSGPC